MCICEYRAVVTPTDTHTAHYGHGTDFLIDEWRKTVQADTMGLEHENEIEEVHPKIKECKRVVGIL